ncbi:hypothetical protein [Paracoccus sp. DMF]|uniref:hypothetical protein n=1 Tax=Paracoccus sp. DMF TaxID=400837 RepID=UPI0021E3D34E|nr:hypothetical protein [Paracoccus sp. DMF]MCV2446170.1 hypothetical protein [Paracoccus sp. DMF]
MTGTKHIFTPCVPGALPGGLRRTEFYDGMVLSERDMKREQSYWQMKRRLTNRALGSGVVWGLSVHWDANARAFTLCPGYGLSCCGDDLVVECPATVSERELVDICSEEFRAILKAGTGPCEDPCERPDGPIEACLMLEYVECPEDSRRVFEDPCATLPGGCRHGAMRETVRLRLVPPPCPSEPGAIERFCARIGKLRQMLAAAGQAAPAEAEFAGWGPPSVMMEVRLRDAGGNALENRRERVASIAERSTDITFQNAAARSIDITLTPPLGYGFFKVRDEAGVETRIETLMELTLSESDLAQNGRMDRRLTVDLAPLAGGASYTLDYHIAATGGTAIAVSARVEAVRGPVRVADCGTLMRDWAFGLDPACATRTLLLAAVWGWFRGLTGTAPCNDPPDEPDRTRAAIPALVSWLAWRILWRIDVTDPKAAQAERCLRQLFEEWCRAFSYRGPRCCDDHHGIHLGRVTLSRKGRILCFDEWSCRRHVLTGPLLTHWTGLFGIAPLDVMATRLAGWICCVARTPDSPLDPVQMKAIQAALWTGNELRIGGGEVLSLKSLLAPGGVMDRFQPPDAAPAPPAPAPAFSAQITRHLEARLDATRIMARAPAIDMMREIRTRLPLAELKPLGDAALFDATLAALGRAQVATVDDLLGRDPEALAERVRAEFIEDESPEDAAAADKAVGLVYTVALRTLEAVGDAVTAVAGERADDEPFTRADLREAATTSAVRRALNEHLRGRGVSTAAIREIAGRVADRR